jgi:hypothetical protein
MAAEVRPGGRRNVSKSVLQAEVSVSRSQPSQFTVRVVDNLGRAEIMEQEAAGGQYWLDDCLRFNRILQLVTKTFQWLA